MSRRKPKYHYCHTWQMNFDFFIGWSWDDFKKYCWRVFKFELPEYMYQDGYTTLIQYGRRTRVLIWLAKVDTPAIAAHEAFHATNFVMDRAGYKPDRNNDEAQAYFLTELMQAMGYK